MKFVCEKSALIKEIVIAQEIISSRHTVSVLSNIYLEAADNTLIIKASDASVTFHTKVPVSVVKEGRIMVKADTFLGILNTIPEGEIEFENTDVKMLIKPDFKKLSFKLNTMYTDQFPEFENPGDAVNFEMPLEDFKGMIKQTIFSVSDDQTRYFMNGVFFEKTDNKFVMVATDGRRMAYAEKDIAGIVSDFKGIIIPDKLLNLILKHSSDEGNITVAIMENAIFVNFGSLYFSSKLIEGQFPNYRRVIPEDFLYKFTVNRKEILDAFRHVALLIEKKNKRVLFNLAKDSMSIITDDTETGMAEEEVGCKYDGEETQIAFNYEYIEDPFKIMTEEEVCFYFSEANKAVTVKPVPESYFFHVLMPMQL
ncbi:MAG: DNA polymerase III subunit beta [Spirochaetaceae bacterium]|jgi:DNA polymerase-3 subunit beta|nr:DNA polymerase III subunit beta [Spirochaetaceae bacterium]